MTDEINNDIEIKKWDVHFRGSDKVLCVEADMSPHQAIAQASFQADWLEMRNGGTINLAHVLAIVPHIEPADAAPPAPDARPNLRDKDGDTWIPGEDADTWHLHHDSVITSTREEIERNYSPVTEVRV
jgi:hypothetical protein